MQELESFAGKRNGWQSDEEDIFRIYSTEKSKTLRIQLLRLQSFTPTAVAAKPEHQQPVNPKKP